MDTPASVRGGSVTRSVSFSARPVVLAMLCGCAHAPSAAPVPEPSVTVRTQFQMGTLVRIAAVDATGDAGDDPADDGGEAAFDAAFAAIDGVVDEMSEWEPDSAVSRVNRDAANGPVVVGPALWHVLDTAMRVARATDGAFDPTWAGLSEVWCFTEGCGLPDRAGIERALQHVGYRWVELDDAASSVRFAHAGVRLGLGGIAKGYALQAASDAMCAAGRCNHLIDAGGDVYARGAGPAGWRVAIAHPRLPGERIDEVTLWDAALVTSGDYQRYIEVDGVRYHHILDPRTGYPPRGAIQVSVVADDPMVADALATAAMVLGPVAGLTLIEEWPGAEALVIDDGLNWARTSGWPGDPVARIARP